TVAAVDEAMMSLTKANAVREENAMLMKPYANWEEFLMPGPLSIAILGELVFISSQTDFSINKHPPAEGFKHIKYPESFRACLMQVCNQGWAAFNEANKNMDQIRIHSMNVPEYMKMAVQTLLQDDIEVVRAMLPDQLENIRSIAEECEKLASSVESKFVSVIDLIHELLEACVNAKNIYEVDLKNVELDEEREKMRKESAELAKKMAEKQFDMINKQMEEAHQGYNKAMDSMPSGWDLIGMQFTEGITTGLASIISGIGNLFNPRSRSASNVENSKSQGSSPKDNPDPFATNVIYSKSSQLLSYAKALTTLRDDKGGIKVKDPYNQQNDSVASKWIEEGFQSLKKEIMNENECDPKKTALTLCDAGIQICEKLEKLALSDQTEASEQEELAHQIEELYYKAQQFDTRSKSWTNSPALSMKPPNVASASKQSRGGESVTQMAVSNARFKIEQTRQQFEKTREMYDKSFENLKKNNEELTEILISMRKCEVKKIDFETTVKMLVKGLDALGRVREQWEKMVRFFQMISNLITASLSCSMNKFVQTAKSSQKI
uniref:Zgc:162509 n=2 Tax=Latimeria chalumnae TaxID=7897 RepID=H3B698_LATCH